MRRAGIISVSIAAITSASWALPAPVDAVWKNADSSAAQVAAALMAAAATPADIISLANEMVLAAVLLATGNPPIAIKGVTAGCAAGATPEAVAADPAGAAVLADACERAAESFAELGIISAAQQATIIQATANIRGGGEQTEVNVGTGTGTEPENPGTDVPFPDEKPPSGN